MPHKARPVHEVKANLFRVLGHPARVRILELLRDEERSVGALQAELHLDSLETADSGKGFDDPPAQLGPGGVAGQRQCNRHGHAPSPHGDGVDHPEVDH